MRFRMKSGMGPDHPVDPITGKRLTVRPGDVVDVSSKDEIAVYKYEQLDPDPPPPQPSTGLEIVHTGGGWYDIVNRETGRKLNATGLRKAEAEAVASLPPSEGASSESQERTDSETPSD